MLISTTEIAYGNIQLKSPNVSTVTFTPEDYPLTINSVITGCGSCTTAAMDKKEVPVGEVGTLKITFTPTSKGVNRKRVTLNITENGVNNVVHIYLNATVA